MERPSFSRRCPTSESRMAWERHIFGSLRSPVAARHESRAGLLGSRMRPSGQWRRVGAVPANYSRDQTEEQSRWRTIRWVSNFTRTR
jgi:hypothetical protein